jgi:CIC family chloride channel protein
MAAIFSGAARTPISTLIMVAEMTGGYGLIVPAMLANILAFLTQSALTAGRRYPTLYESQVPSREDSPVHRGVLLRRALALIEGDDETFAGEDLSLPRLVSLLRFGRPISIVQPGAEGAFLVTLDLAPGSELAGKSVQEGIGAVLGATAVAVLRGEEMSVPRGPTRLEAGDRVIAVATPEAYETLKERAAGA